MAGLAWGNYSNGSIPPGALAEVDNFVPLWGTHSSVTVLSNLLRADAARQCRLLQAAFKAHFGKNLNVSEGYRTYFTQQAYKDDQARGGAVAAEPGTSVHGWALAIDFGSGVATYGTPEKIWMDANAPKYGFDPAGNTFVARGFKANEAWHFEFTLTPTITTGPTLEESGNSYTPLPEGFTMEKGTLYRNSSKTVKGKKNPNYGSIDLCSPIVGFHWHLPSTAYIALLNKLKLIESKTPIDLTDSQWRFVTSQLPKYAK